MEDIKVNIKSLISQFNKSSSDLRPPIYKNRKPDLTRRLDNIKTTLNSYHYNKTTYLDLHKQILTILLEVVKGNEAIYLNSLETCKKLLEQLNQSLPDSSGEPPKEELTPKVDEPDSTSNTSYGTKENPIKATVYLAKPILPPSVQEATKDKEERGSVQNLRKFFEKINQQVGLEIIAQIPPKPDGRLKSKSTSNLFENVKDKDPILTRSKSTVQIDKSVDKWFNKQKEPEEASLPKEEDSLEYVVNEQQDQILEELVSKLSQSEDEFKSGVSKESSDDDDSVFDDEDSQSCDSLN